MMRWLAVAVGFVLMVNSVDAQPLRSVAIPSAIAANTTTAVMVRSPISAIGLIPGGMLLLRVPPTGAPVNLGVLRDDGKEGDQVAGDQIYALRVSLTEPPGSVKLQVSIAIRGQLRRVIHDTINITVTSPPTNLPPDPAASGMATLVGIDSDSDGVRDDVQRYIELAHPASAKTRAALRQVTQAMQSVLIDAGNENAATARMIEFSRAMECFISFASPVAAGDALENLAPQVLNTQARTSAFSIAEQQFSGHLYKFSSPSQRRAFCVFDPLSLPN